ncbi:hypothetical protein VD0001_g9930, partial [Verticillium dahliae]
DAAATAALAAPEAEAESSTSAGLVYLKGIYDAMVKKVSDGADKYKENYKGLLESGDLWDRLTVQCVATFALFHSDNLPIRDAAALKSLPPVNGVDAPGWYLILVQDEEDPEFLRLYAGQAGTQGLQKRRGDHRSKA